MTMKRTDALRIATNFYTFRMGTKPESMAIARMDPADGRITMRTTTHDENEEDVTYEIVLDPTTDALTMRRVLDEYRVSDFAQGSKPLSTLKEGDLFRLEGDCVIYRFLRSEMLYKVVLLLCPSRRTAHLPTAGYYGVSLRRISAESPLAIPVVQGRDCLFCILS